LGNPFANIKVAVRKGLWISSLECSFATGTWTWTPGTGIWL